NDLQSRLAQWDGGEGTAAAAPSTKQGRSGAPTEDAQQRRRAGGTGEARGPSAPRDTAPAPGRRLTPQEVQRTLPDPHGGGPSVAAEASRNWRELPDGARAAATEAIRRTGTREAVDGFLYLANSPTVRQPRDFTQGAITQAFQFAAGHTDAIPTLLEPT